MTRTQGTARGAGRGGGSGRLSPGSGGASLGAWDPGGQLGQMLTCLWGLGRRRGEAQGVIQDQADEKGGVSVGAGEAGVAAWDSGRGGRSDAGVRRGLWLPHDGICSDASQGRRWVVSVSPTYDLRHPFTASPRQVDRGTGSVSPADLWKEPSQGGDHGEGSWGPAGPMKTSGRRGHPESVRPGADWPLKAT